MAVNSTKGDKMTLWYGSGKMVLGCGDDTTLLLNKLLTESCGLAYMSFQKLNWIGTLSVLSALCEGFDNGILCVSVPKYAARDGKWNSIPKLGIKQHKEYKTFSKKEKL